MRSQLSEDCSDPIITGVFPSVKHLDQNWFVRSPDEMTLMTDTAHYSAQYALPPRALSSVLAFYLLSPLQRSTASGTEANG